MFEKASKLKLRYTSTKGNLSTEQLWDLSLIQLNEVAKTLSKEIKDAGEEDFINLKTEKDTVLTLKLDIVKHIIAAQLAKQEAAANAAAKRQKRNEILDLMARKQTQVLEGKSLDELQKELEALDA